MNYFQLIVIALILAVDATVYAFSYGLVLRQQRARAAFWLALTVGVFQAGMPLLGYWGGDVMRSVVDSWAPWIVLVVFGALGGNIIFQAWKGEEEETAPPTPLGIMGLTLVGIATSIDALAVGISFACIGMDTFRSILWPIIVIGIVSFLFSVLGCFIGIFFGKRVNLRAELWAGIILIGIGVKILMEHLSF